MGQFVQYFSKIAMWHLNRKSVKGNLVTMGDKSSPLQLTTSQRIGNLASPISDFRVLLRYYGLIPMLQWIIHVETHPSKSRYLQTLYRLENLFNVCYYPLEHVYWLAAHNIISITPETRDKVGMWSCRFWAAYVFTYFVHLYEDYKDLLRREKRLIKDGENVDSVREEKKALMVNAMINAAYAPLTVHWSLEKSSFPDIGVGLCGAIAAVGQLWAAWRAA